MLKLIVPFKFLLAITFITLPLIVCVWSGNAGGVVPFNAAADTCILRLIIFAC